MIAKIAKLLTFKNHMLQRELLPRLSRLRNKPSTVHASITYTCNLRCKMCRLWDSNWNELSTDEWKRTINELRGWLGTYTFKMVGGEPLMRKDAIELIKYASSLGLYTGLSTNGLLIDEKTAKELVDSGLNEIHISLDSIEPEGHAYTRNSQGAFEKAVNAIELLQRQKELKQSRMTINLATVIHRNNIHELDRIADFVEQKGIYSVVYQPLFQTFGESYNPTWYKTSSLWPDDYSAVESALNKLIKIRNSKGHVGNKASQLEAMKLYFKNPLTKAAVKCQAGANEIAIEPDGRILLCYNLPKIGSVHDGSIKGTVFGEAAMQRRKEIAGCSRNCNLMNCNYEK